MRNLITAGAILLIAVPLCLVLGYEFVPNVHNTQGHFTAEFWFNSYLILWGFLFTTAAVGPLVAQFLQWREDRAWREARLNAKDRLASGLSAALNEYLAFLRTVAANDPHQVALLLIDSTLKGLDDFFDSYEVDQATFNAPMHSAASSVRRELQPLRRSLLTTRHSMNRRQSCRLYLGQEALGKLRALFDLPAPPPGAQLSTDPYFVAHGEVFVDASLDRAIGVPSVSLYRFAPIDVELIRREWQRFVTNCPGAGELEKLDFSFEYDADSQARLHAKYVKSHLQGWLQAYIVNERIAAESAHSENRSSDLQT